MLDCMRYQEQLGFVLGKQSVLSCFINGYTPFKVTGQNLSFNGLPQFLPLDTSNFGAEWYCDVAWLSNYVANDVSSIVNILAFDSI